MFCPPLSPRRLAPLPHRAAGGGEQLWPDQVLREGPRRFPHLNRLSELHHRERRPLAELVDAAHGHLAHLFPLLRATLAEAGVSPDGLACVCYTKGPGLGTPLQVATAAAQALLLLWGKPLIGVNHCIVHIKMGHAVTGAVEPAVLYISGGNTQVIAYSKGRYKLFGETIDIAVGIRLDCFTRVLELSTAPSPEQ